MKIEGVWGERGVIYKCRVRYVVVANDIGDDYSDITEGVGDGRYNSRSFAAGS